MVVSRSLRCCLLTLTPSAAIGCDASQLSGYTLPANANSSIIPVGSSVTVDTKCRVGYRPENDTTTTTCQADGTWSFDNVKCTGT